MTKVTVRSGIRPFDWCPNQRPWMTLNGRYALSCRKDASFGARHKNLNVDKPILSAAKMFLAVGGLCGYSQRFPGEGRQTSAGCRERQFSAFSLAIFSETLQLRPVLLPSDTQSVVGFSVIPKCMTLNDLERLFRVKFCSRTVWLAPTVRLS